VSRVTVQPAALEALRTLAQMHGVSAVEYLDALLNYAWSQHRRPGSWEACCPFDYANYSRAPYDPNGPLTGGCADRWWTPPGERSPASPEAAP
jgi:hypothetical protein